MNTLLRFYAVLAVFLFTGCGALERIHQADGVGLGVHGTPDISDKGFQLYLDFELAEGTKYKETIQRLAQPDNRGDWEGVEAHRHYGDPPRMIWPDVQRSVYSPDIPWEHRRVNTVNPGKTEDTPYGVFHTTFPFFTFSAYFKGVVMIEGFLDEDGKPIMNKLYFSAGGLQGGRVVEEDVAGGLTYEIIAWHSQHPNNPNLGKATLRLRVLDSTVTREWKSD